MLKIRRFGLSRKCLNTSFQKPVIPETYLVSLFIKILTQISQNLWLPLAPPLPIIIFCSLLHIFKLSAWPWKHFNFQAMAWTKDPWGWCCAVLQQIKPLPGVSIPHITVPLQVLATPCFQCGFLLMHLGGSEQWSKHWVPTIQWETRIKFWAPDFSLVQP